MKSVLRLGTRRSLLAWAQSSWVAREVERLNSGIQVELVGIDTRGDRIQDISLRNVAGKEFFVAELDDALNANAVDFTVHSLKDLSLDRPSVFRCAAIPVRENPRDVVLFGPSALRRLQQGETLRIGTSSPRRIENVPDFLKKALPQDDRVPSLQFVEIRGNVNTRLARVHESLGSERYLDAVVLAFAGLSRLWSDAAGQVELKKLLQGVRWMVLPVPECPAAPGQGALAIECRANDARTLQALNPLHHPETAERIAAERQLLADWGGGCHQRFGATALRLPDLGQLLYIRGAKSDGQWVDELRWNSPQTLKNGKTLQAWDGSEWRGSDVLSRNESLDLNKSAIFVAHSRAVTPKIAAQFQQKRIWTSGAASWFRLAKMGVWVEGCAENLGFSELIPTLQASVLELPNWESWGVLTHEEANGSWEKLNISVFPTYKINSNYGTDAKEALERSSYLFWSSGSQFDALKEYVSPHAKHACGPGKTAARLREHGIQPDVFPTAEEWRKWLKIIQ
jgi:hydroxymethylbilane synthase